MDNPLFVAAAMVAGGALLLFVVAALLGQLWPAPPEPWTPDEPEPAPVLRDEWQRLAAYAAAARERAARARAEAAGALRRSATAEAARELAWHEYETVEMPLLPAVATGAAAPPRELAHAAFVAYRQGAITVRELQDVWRGAAPVDPEEEERARLARQRVLRQRDARQAYDRAAGEARVAAEEARVAEVAAEALAGEADEARREADEARARLTRIRVTAPGR